MKIELCLINILIVNMKWCSAFEKIVNHEAIPKRSGHSKQLITLVPAKRPRCSHLQDSEFRVEELAHAAPN